MAQAHRAVGCSAKSREYSLAIGAAPMTSVVLADCSDSAGHLELRRSNAGHILADLCSTVHWLPVRQSRVPKSTMIAEFSYRVQR